MHAIAACSYTPGIIVRRLGNSRVIGQPNIGLPLGVRFGRRKEQYTDKKAKEQKNIFHKTSLFVLVNGQLQLLCSKSISE
jgi:hypothetical protein